MEPDLRDELEMEAAESGMTLSAYIELTLRQRNFGGTEDAYNTLWGQYEQLMEQLDELARAFEAVQREKAATNFSWLTPISGPQIDRLLGLLGAAFPGREAEDLLIGSLETAALNTQNHFFTYALQDRLARPELAKKIHY